MQKNYLLSNAELTTNPLKSTSEKRIQKNIVTTCLLALFTLLGFSDAFGQFPGNDNTPGVGKTFNVPANVTHVNAAAWGAGGGGGGSNANNAGGNGGGGGGSVSNQIGVSSGNTFTYTVGTAGAAGAAGAAGSNGTFSAITSATPLTNMNANGGTGGLANAAALGTPTNSGGGTASGGTNSSGINGTQGGSNGGNGGDSGTSFTFFGNGGNGGNNSVGSPGGQPGAGGGGGIRSMGTNRAGGAGAPGRVMFDFITVSNVTPSPVCVGSTITITGTNFSALGSTTITVNGIACTSVVVVNTTTITAVVGAGTTSGVVDINNNGRRNNGRTITVNPLPATIAGGSATVCAGASTPAFTNATGGGTWSIVNGTGSATISGGGVVTGVSAGTATVVYTLPTTCSVSTPITINAAPTITTNPVNSTINVGTNTSFSVVANNSPNATGYVWQVSTNGGGTWTTVTNGGVYSNATTATLNITGATIGMDGYMYHASASNACGTSAYSTNATLNVTLAYCTPSFTSGVEPISNVTFNTINNNSANTCGAGTSYENFTGVSTSVFRGFTYNLSATGNTCGNWTDYVYAYFDWNRDGDFLDAGESYNLGTINNTTAGVLTQAITIPIGATLGTTRMRIIKNFNTAPTDPCRTGAGFGQAEDYTITIVAPPACTTPTAQPTALGLTPSGTSIAGTFTAASPVSDSYLVVISTSATPPSAPVNGTTYAIGSSLASGYIVVDNDSNTTFTAGGLNISTTYYFYIFSFNGLCTGGPLYNATSPLTGNATTTAVGPTYCTPSSVSSAVYISSIRSVGTINDVTNGPTGYSAGGYGNFSATTIATQVAGSGINLEIIVTGSYGTGPSCPSTSQFIKTWVDWNKDGDFDDAGEQVYVSGTDVAPVATALDNIYGFVVPSGTFPGNYRMRVRTRAYCDTSTLLPCATGYATGETEDYTIAVIEDCPSKILTVTNGSACGPTNTVTLNATKTASATGFRWYANLTGGAPLATTAVGTWTTPSISATTTYYVTAYDGVCETIHRTPVVATILPTSNITVTPSVPEVCGEGNVVQITASGDFVTETLLLQTFESGMAPFTVTTPVNTNGGADTPWSVKTSVYVPAATSVWRPALNSGAIGTTGNNFAFTTSDYNNSNIQTIMTSPVINASLYTTLNLTFDQMYGAFSGDSAVIEASTNGTTWTAIATYTATDIGTPAVFTKMGPINLNAYAGNANLQIRFVYTAQWDDGWAVDNIKVEGVRPLNTTFTWTGGSVNAFTDPGLTTPYVDQSVSTVYVVPTAMQLASPSWSFTANATLGNGCPIAQLITINNKTKLWKGTVDNNWYNANNWEPAGVPDATTCVFIYDGPFDSNINNIGNDAFAKTLTVRPSGLLEIQPNNDLTVTDNVTVDAGGTFNIENSGSLIQVNNLANTGNISMKRNVNLRRLDYVYWSSPVANYGLNSISTTTYRYKWIPTIGANTNGWGNWSLANETMVLGKGYIVRGPDNYSTTIQNYTQNFVGVPNNGIINMPISRGTYDGANYTTGVSTTPATRDDDNWNLIGNPYPSAINANTFLATNTNIAGFIKYWTHGTLPSAVISDPFYNNYGSNYTVADYVTYNATGANPAIGNGNIAAGQGFFVLMNHTSAATTENVVFNNTMRRNDYRNDLFYRNGNETNLGEGEKHRIWLNLISPSATSSPTLIGYIDGATNDLDRMFDAPALDVKTNFELYSFSNSDKLNIQGKALPFNANDQISLGVKISQNGIHTIGISTADGLFENNTQNIYLEDKTLGITHDLRSMPYSFTATVGSFENRFVLKFNNETLSNEDFTANAVTVFTNENINVIANNQTIKSVRIFDLLGRVLGNFNNVNASTFEAKNVAKTQSALLVEVTLDNGATKTYKVIF